MRAVESSLARLRTDWIDLYQLHWPDPLTPIEETLRALDDLVHQGKVRYIGCSNLDAWQVADAAWTARHHGLTAFICAQNEYSLLVRDQSDPLFPALAQYGMGLLPYFPLGGGLLTGKYKRGAPLPDGRLKATQASAERFLTERNWALTSKLERFAAERGHTLIELAFGWLASHDTIPSIIAGATKPEQIDANVAAAGWRLSPDERAALDPLLEG
jgi:aryl-alcohol dehydrogenase-like predicted oxidoreductase